MDARYPAFLDDSHVSQYLKSPVKTSTAAKENLKWNEEAFFKRCNVPQASESLFLPSGESSINASADAVSTPRQSLQNIRFSLNDNSFISEGANSSLGILQVENFDLSDSSINEPIKFCKKQKSKKKVQRTSNVCYEEKDVGLLKEKSLNEISEAVLPNLTDKNSDESESKNDSSSDIEYDGTNIPELNMDCDILSLISSDKALVSENDILYNSNETDASNRREILRDLPKSSFFRSSLAKDEIMKSDMTSRESSENVRQSIFENHQPSLNSLYQQLLSGKKDLIDENKNARNPQTIRVCPFLNMSSFEVEPMLGKKSESNIYSDVENTRCSQNLSVDFCPEQISFMSSRQFETFSAEKSTEISDIKSGEDISQTVSHDHYEQSFRSEDLGNELLGGSHLRVSRTKVDFQSEGNMNIESKAKSANSDTFTKKFLESESEFGDLGFDSQLLNKDLSGENWGSRQGISESDFFSSEAAKEILKKDKEIFEKEHIFEINNKLTTYKESPESIRSKPLRRRSRTGIRINNRIRIKKLTSPITPLCLKRSINAKRNKVVKTFEQIKLEEISKKQKELGQLLRRNEIVHNRMKQREHDAKHKAAQGACQYNPNPPSQEELLESCKKQCIEKKVETYNSNQNTSEISFSNRYNERYMVLTENSTDIQNKSITSEPDNQLNVNNETTEFPKEVSNPLEGDKLPGHENLSLENNSDGFESNFDNQEIARSYCDSQLNNSDVSTKSSSKLDVCTNELENMTSNNLNTYSEKCQDSNSEYISSELEKNQPDLESVKCNIPSNLTNADKICTDLPGNVETQKDSEYSNLTEFENKANSKCLSDVSPEKSETDTVSENDFPNGNTNKEVTNIDAKNKSQAKNVNSEVCQSSANNNQNTVSKLDKSEKMSVNGQTKPTVVPPLTFNNPSLLISNPSVPSGSFFQNNGQYQYSMILPVQTVPPAPAVPVSVTKPVLPSGVDQVVKYWPKKAPAPWTEAGMRRLHHLGFESQGGSSAAVDLKIFLPDHSTVVVNVRKNSTTEEVYQAVIEKIGMSKEVAKFFALFEIVEYGFARKLHFNEYPHNLYIQNYSTATSTCLLIRKWLFTLSKEIELTQDNMAATFFYWQAVDDVNKGQIKAGNKRYELTALQDFSRKLEYLKLVRQLDGYGEISFPHCTCDVRKEGHVVATVGLTNFKLQACKDDGTLESQIIDFNWGTVKEWELDDEGMSFCFKYAPPDKKPRYVKIYTPYYVFLYDCFVRIQDEKKWSINGE